MASSVAGTPTNLGVILENITDLEEMQIIILKSHTRMPISYVGKMIF